MAIYLRIFENAIPMLDEIAKANYGQGLDALDHAGTVIREASRKGLRTKTTKFSQFYENGKLKVRSTGGNIQQILGQRISHKNKGNMADPSSMESFITSNLDPKTMIMVVGGKHSRLRPKQRRDGGVIGDLGIVGAVSKRSYAILQKLNSGDGSDKYYENIYENKEQKAIFKHLREKGNYKPQHFMEEGYSNARGRVAEIMTTTLEKLIHRQINRANVIIKEVKAG